MNILLLHNPTAGDDRPSERELVELLRAARHDVSCVATDDPQLAQRLVEKVDLLLVAGGDGTVATVLEKIEGAAAPLGILPLGTANNFARALGIEGEIEAIIDGPDPEMPSHYHARGHADAPEIDGLVRLKGKNLRPGDIVRAKVTGADGYDLAARLIGEPR